MKIIKTPIKDLILIKNKKFDDKRGYFREVLVEKLINSVDAVLIAECLESGIDPQGKKRRNLLKRLKRNTLG